MKKRLFFALVALLALSACMRDEDWNLLRHPIHIQGHMDPSYGVPAAYGKMTFHDAFMKAKAEHPELVSK